MEKCDTKVRMLIGRAKAAFQSESCLPERKLPSSAKAAFQISATYLAIGKFN